MQPHYYTKPPLDFYQTSLSKSYVPMYKQVGGFPSVNYPYLPPPLKQPYNNTISVFYQPSISQNNIPMYYQPG
ncbi:hypothetical protein [Legionella busanensis]|uniref:hypothetical protein n=1 Tax=Legionella busanensis TaxID=190655 RepID=UPI000E1C3A13|nr:hypothetical protein [Legionella busanensis]